MLDAVMIHCPYCGEPIEILIEPSDDAQSYVEDCQVCCRPINISVQTDVDGELIVSAGSQDEV